MYVPLRYDFVVQVIKNGRWEVKNSLMRNNGCHMPQENVIKFGIVLPHDFPARIAF